MKIERILYNMDRAKREYEFWCKAKEVYDRCAAQDLGDYPDLLFRAYMQTGTTAGVAQIMNERGLRKITGKKFLPRNVGTLIRNTDIEDVELMHVARALLCGGGVSPEELDEMIQNDYPELR